MRDYLPTKDRDLQAWLVNFLAVAGANLETLGLTSADLSSLSGDTSDMGTSLTAITALKAQLEGEVADKNGFSRSAQSEARGLVKRIQATVGVPDSLKLSLGINPGTGVRTHNPPVQPAALLATPQADGTNSLKWHKMGNKATTQFVVYAKPLTGGVSVSTDTGWTMVGQTTRAAFQHRGVTPGVPMAYKVQAMRADLASEPSLPATVYTG